MSPMKRNTASGVITFHTPFHVSLLKSQECMTDLKDISESRKSLSQPSVRMRSTSRCVRVGRRDETSPSGPQQGPKQDRLSYTSLRRLQAKMEAENQQKRDIIQPLVDTENGFVKELESFLSQRDVAELRRRELLHKRWTERVWMPLQRRVEQRVSSCTPEETKRRQTLYSHYLHHCNSKGFVFLDTGDLREYNPFLLNVKNKHHFKLNTVELKDSLYLQLHERLKEKRTASSCEAGYKYTSSQVEKLPQSDRPLTESVTPPANTLSQASSYYLVSASRQTPVQDETDGRKSGRLDTIPRHIIATTAPDGRCHQSGCWFSR
ncbi:protein FAM228A isoform X1 [Thunnus albacares]|uniref:protein FAM228A isoform X1 n=1 Tax=Thunnus albacares TaxID=8236 RepID=UPI001CF67F29|nr:protein FAM228A isoform X1 [Thunnus albacares]XP_044232802.1 protein FAM228A isoform X1 [Thunnus albacares]XP_044232803.1 protein FAM228A isoform X1 [Thunnus albacares]XP_044232804.1 protein FAM228A isoform X1 [Thunnus albacares]